MKVGKNCYTNFLPFYYWFNSVEIEGQRVEFINEVPAVLNHSLMDGRLHLSAISAFTYTKRFTELTILPDLSVSAQKYVNSIFLFSRVPIEELNGETVALTKSSDTSIALLKILLKRHLHLNCDYVKMTPDLNQMLQVYPAAMIIGDDAIKEKWNCDEGIYIYDLCSLWYEMTGHPMTFGLFAVRNEFLESNPDAVHEVWRNLVKSKEMSYKNKFQPMITEIRRDLGGDLNFWEDYFNNLRFDLSDEEKKGLQLFYDLAFEENLTPSRTTLSYLPVSQR